MNKIIVSLAIAFSALAVNAANVKWTNATGDGKWDTDGNWEGGAKPTADDHAVFPDTDTTVTVDGDVKAAIIRTEGNSSATISMRLSRHRGHRPTSTSMLMSKPLRAMTDGFRYITTIPSARTLTFQHISFASETIPPSRWWITPTSRQSI